MKCSPDYQIILSDVILNAVKNLIRLEVSHPEGKDRQSMLNYTLLKPEECEFVDIGAVDELPNGKRLFLDIDEFPIVVFNLAGQFFAIGDVCSHDNGPLGEGDLDGEEVICPRHGARFDLRTGKVLALPAVEDIPAYPVQVVDGRIQVGIPLK